MRDLLRRYGFAVAIAGLYLYSFPYFFPAMKHANELPRIYLTKAMVNEGTFAIDTGVRRWGETVDVSPSGGHYYSNKAPGASLLAAPVYLLLKGVRAAFGESEPNLAQMTWTFRVATGVIPTLFFLVLLWHFLARYAPRRDTRRLIVAGYALGSMAMTYSILIHGHQLSAICIATSFILIVWVVEDGLDARWLLAAGFFAGCAPLVDYQAAFAGVPIAVYLSWRLLSRSPRRWKGLAMAAIGAVPPIAFLLYYHDAAFGSPFRTGYDATEFFAHHHQVGFLGIEALRMERFVGSTIAPDNGLVFFCPMLLLAFPGWYLLARRRQWWPFAITLSIALIYILFISSITFWRGGWQVGPRYITAMLPFVLIPVAVAIAAAEGRWFLRAGSVALVTVGIVVYALSSAEYPHFPEYFGNPLYEVTFRLVADGHAPYNAGYALGLRGLGSLIPYLLLLGLVVAWIAAPARKRLASAVVGLAAAALIIAAYSVADGGGKRADAGYQRIAERHMPQ